MQIQSAATLLPSEDHDILDIRWSPERDNFVSTVRDWSEAPVTKRAVLSQTARLFDPLGWLAPVVVRAKLLIQTAWLLRLDWDTPMADEEADVWRQLQSELTLLEDIRIPRWIRSDAPSCTAEIHGFASERGYGAVIYLRTIIREDIQLSLLLAKNRSAQTGIPSPAGTLRGDSPNAARITHKGNFVHFGAGTPMNGLHDHLRMDLRTSHSLDDIRGEQGRRDSENADGGLLAPCPQPGQLRLQGDFPLQSSQPHTVQGVPEFLWTHPALWSTETWEPWNWSSRSNGPPERTLLWKNGNRMS